MQDIRRGCCGLKLGMGVFIELQIKCTRCKTVIFLRVEYPKPAHHECRTLDDTLEKISTKKHYSSPGRLPATA